MSFYPCKGKIYLYNGQGKDKENGIAWGKAGIKIPSSFGLKPYAMSYKYVYLINN